MLFVRQRPFAINAMRGLLAEFGIIAPSRRVNVANLGALLLSGDGLMPHRARTELLRIFAHITAIDDQSSNCRRTSKSRWSKMQTRFG
jgi:hypothetical protein